MDIYKLWLCIQKVVEISFIQIFVVGGLWNSIQIIHRFSNIISNKPLLISNNMIFFVCCVIARKSQTSLCKI
jgi:hypothetical protein